MITGNGKVTTKQPVHVANGVLEITQALGKGKVSSTGKSTVMLSTGGFQPIPGTDYRYNLVVIKKA